MQEQNASPINLMLLLVISYLLHKSNITQLGIFSIQLLIIEIHQSFPHSNNRIIQITPPVMHSVHPTLSSSEQFVCLYR